MPKGSVTVGPRSELLSGEIPVRDLVLHLPGDQVDGVRVRSHGRRHDCSLRGGLTAGRHGNAEIELLSPAERTAPGQLACLYAGDLVVGRGTIA